MSIDLIGMALAIFGLVIAIIGIFSSVISTYQRYKREKAFREGRKRLEKCPKCGSMKLRFDPFSSIPSPDSGKRKYRVTCYDCGETWEEEYA